MIVTVLQFTENLTHRQAAEAVRDRITWKYAVGLELEDQGFDPTVLSEFRDRLVREDLTRLALDALLERLFDQGLVKVGGQGEDRFHPCGGRDPVVEPPGAGRGEPAGDAGGPGGGASGLADQRDRPVVAAGVRGPDRQPASAHQQDQAGRTDGRLRAGRVPPARPGLRPDRAGLAASSARGGGAAADLDPAVLPRRGPCHRPIGGATAGSRPGRGRLPPGHLRIISPYDLDARYSIKRDHGWGGYKVHFTETCNAPASEPDTDPGRPSTRGEVPNLITNVVTTTATVPDVEMTAPIHQ